MKIKETIWIGLMILISGCWAADQPGNAEGSTSYYTCSMHPEVHQDHPGDCPVCHMKLIKVESAPSGPPSKQVRIKLNSTQIRLAGIHTDTVRLQPLAEGKVLTGTVSADETRTEETSARVPGRVERLFIRSLGEEIRVGQPVYTIYSEELLEAEREYLLARQQQKSLNNPDIDYKRLIDAAALKLSLWGLSSLQIRNLAASGKAQASTTVLSKTGGTVSEIFIHEGDYVEEGSPILKTQDLSSLWVEAQLYATEVPAFSKKSEAWISLPELGSEPVKGRIEFLNPELSGASRVVLMRISLPNRDGRIRAGMMAYVSLQEGDARKLAIPATAVVSGGKGNKVWIKNTDGSFSPRMVKLGAGNQAYVAVESGLKAGEVVVSSGAYLLNSEAVFKL